MALITPIPPPAVTRAFREGLITLLAGPSHGSAGTILRQGNAGSNAAIPSQADVGLLGGITPEHDPQQIFALGLSHLASGSGMAAALPAGWRLYAGNAPGKICHGRVIERHPGDWKLTACFWGDRVWNAFQESLGLRSLPAVQTANYELRLLAIAGLNLEAFWLVAQQSGLPDFVVPFPAAPLQPIPGLNVTGDIRMADFLSVVVPLAKQRMTAPKHHVS
jgi:hypothetical protein